MNKYWVKKHPSPFALSVRLCAIPAGEIAGDWQQMTEADVAEWEAQQIAAGWVAATPQPEPPQPWRVSKDTLISRVLAAGALPQVMTALVSQSAEQQFVFAQSAWFWNNNATLRGLCAALGLNADDILAPDPYL